MAMTMNFDVPDPEVLAELRSGQEISFTLLFTGSSYQVVDVNVVGMVEASDEWARLGERMVRTERAADFALTDQDGAPLRLADLAGRAVLLDFIFTQCPGPCPILTAKHVAVQRAVPAELVDAVRFVSISLDPENDTPAALRAYAEKHGASLANWSFLTGEAENVSAVIRAYAVGKTRDADGQIVHLVAAFLIDGTGRILDRYLGLEHASAAIAADLTALARNPSGS
jgi:protein SCO1/2